MNKTPNDNAIPCMVLTFSEPEIALVKAVLEADGYGDDLRGWILDNMQEDADEGKYTGSADRVISGLSNYLREHPETLQAAGQYITNIVRRATKKGGR